MLEKNKIGSMGNKEMKNKKMCGCFPPHGRELKKRKRKDNRKTKERQNVGFIFSLSSRTLKKKRDIAFGHLKLKTRLVIHVRF